MRLPGWIRRLIELRALLRSKHRHLPEDDLFTDLFIRRLEDRRVLDAVPTAIFDDAGMLHVDAGQADGQSDSFRVTSQGEEVQVSVNN